MIEVTYRKRTFHVAESWNELSGTQVRQLMDVLHKPDKDPVRLQLHVWKIISGLKWCQYFMLPNHFVLNTLSFVDFVFKENDLTNQLFPKVKKFYGPHKDFDNLKVHEFIFADMYHKQYADNQDVVALNKLIAVLYRKADQGYDLGNDPNGDLRAPFNSNLIACNESKVAKWPADLKQAILTWYVACKKSLIADNPEVFSKGGGGGGATGVESMLAIMRSVAKDGTYGDFDKVEQMYLKTLMMELKERIRDAEESKRRMAT